MALEIDASSTASPPRRTGPLADPSAVSTRPPAKDLPATPREAREEDAARSSAPASVFGTTFHSGFAAPRFAARARRVAVPERLDRMPRPRFLLLDELRLFVNVLVAATRFRTLLLFSSRGYLKPELLAALVLGWLPRRARPTIVLYGEMFQPSGGWRGRLERFVMRAAQRGVDRYVLFSEVERPSFERTWGLPIDKTVACLCFLPDVEAAEHHVEPAAPEELPVRPGERYVFAGGSSFRNYAPLIEAARSLPDVPFVICARDLGDPALLPPNIRLGSLDRRIYRPLLEGAGVVVVPLRTDVQRASGMFTYLRSMQLGKPTIVSDSLAVREYIEDGVTGLVVQDTAAAYAAAIGFAFDPANAEAVAAIGRRGCDAVARRNTVVAYADTMMAIVDAATAEAPARAKPEPAAFNPH